MTDMHLSDARYQLQSLREFKGTDEAYIDSIWTMRDDAHGPVKKSRKKGWPFVRAEHKSNVEQLRKKVGR